MVDGGGAEGYRKEGRGPGKQKGRRPWGALKVRIELVLNSGAGWKPLKGTRWEGVRIADRKLGVFLRGCCMAGSSSSSKTPDAQGSDVVTSHKAVTSCKAAMLIPGSPRGAGGILLFIFGQTRRQGGCNSSDLGTLWQPLL